MPISARSTICRSFFTIICLVLFSSCTEEKTYVTNNPLVDQRPPSVEWTSINGRTDFQSVVSGSVEVAFQARDESGIDSVRLYIDGLLRISLTPDSSQAGRLTYAIAYSWNTLADSDGVHNLAVRAFDKAGNSGETPVLLLRVSNTTPPPPPDRTPPVITWLSPASGSTVRETTEFQFLVTDSSTIDSVKIYIDGEVASIIAGQEDSLFSMSWNSWRWTNGRRIVEARAWDRAGNQGVGQPLGLTVDNHRVIWVPDDFEKIQDAINATVDGDTIIVRAGTYHEQLQFFDKNVSFISESGPEETIIDGTNYFTGVWITGGQDTTMVIRGFTFSNMANDPYERYGAYLVGSSPTIINNVFTGNTVRESRGMQIGQNNAIIRNNLFINLGVGIEISHSWGSDFSNNMLLNISYYGMWSIAADGQFLAPDYNLFWNVQHFDSTYFHYKPNNIIGLEPTFLEGTFKLTPESPGVDQGRPDFEDFDGTISDIGVYGGPYAYR